MTYYWIVAQHSGKVLDVYDGSINNSAKIIQYSKKSGNDSTVGNQLWSFDGGFIVNKKSGLVLHVTDGKIEKDTPIVQFERHAEPAINQEREYNYRDNTISLRANRNFVLDVKGASRDNEAIIKIHNKVKDQINQQFILQKWNDTTTSDKFGGLVTKIIDHNRFLPKLSQNLLEILEDDEYYDVTIEVGDDPYVKIFRAHMVILNYRSPYLRRILSTIKKKNDGTLAHIKLPNILPETFQIILRYIYSGRISLEECDISDIVKILVAAGELGLEELITYIQSFLIESKANKIEQNFDLIYKTSFENNSFLELQKYCTDLISNEPDKIFKLPNFSSIPEKLLISLIQSDKLQMSEIQVWEHVLEWGFAQNTERFQNSRLSSDPKKFSKDDFNSLKHTLQRCIPFIRFYNLTSKEFSKIIPYGRILPKELYMKLLTDFLNSDSNLINKPKPRITEIKRNSSKNFDSKIITSQHAELISKWIDKLNIMDEIKNSYEFKLIFRKSRDECDDGSIFTSKNFHKICDNQSNTVTIVKVKGSEEILGGYNPIEWKSGDKWGATKDSFIFSFKNDYKIENHILSRVMDENNAIDNRTYCGPSFGNGDLVIWGFDLNSFGSYCRSSKTSYEKPIRESEDKFIIEECEVFRLMSKF